MAKLLEYCIVKGNLILQLDILTYKKYQVLQIISSQSIIINSKALRRFYFTNATSIHNGK